MECKVLYILKQIKTDTCTVHKKPTETQRNTHSDLKFIKRNERLGTKRDETHPRVTFMPGECPTPDPQRHHLKNIGLVTPRATFPIVCTECPHYEESTGAKIMKKRD